MARLRPEQLAPALSKGLAPIYLVSGDEPLLVQEACDAIRQAVRQAGFKDRELYHADAGFDWTQVLSAANSLSLFAEQKLLEVRLPTGKPGDKGSKVLQEYAKAPSPDNILLLVAGKLDRSALNTKWAKALEQVGTHIQVWPLPPAQLPRWIGQRLQAAGLKAESSAIDLLASRVEGNLLAASQEIEKLKLLAPDQSVSAELMASVVADSARYNVFALTDKALRGDARGAVKTLQGLRGEGTEPLALLWALTREIRLLVQIGQSVSQGVSFERAAQQARVREQQKPLLQSALRRLKPAQAQQLLRKANGIDKAIKGMRNASPWDELLDLTLNVAGVRSLHPSNDRLSLKLDH
ncbi:DNA polymerase III subunit delta [Marinimicrobium sp. ABcell2]|uniref:DNA polymerase III subunit delta n=1 Tax=Marinimicrobium sp. ABcell2 TaxID=3069751 RepID=UPI0027AF6F4A|nr:DNA polymerase III subunit delta [Marinimicrobium sp. ABcell2]MDQ2077695.1 DNA polymerase III subunit delta [Marinimicrobium sp. ABcell2]